MSPSPTAGAELGPRPGGGEVEIFSICPVASPVRLSGAGLWLSFCRLSFSFQELGWGFVAFVGPFEGNSVGIGPEFGLEPVVCLRFLSPFSRRRLFASSPRG